MVNRRGYSGEGHSLNQQPDGTGTDAAQEEDALYAKEPVE